MSSRHKKRRRDVNRAGKGCGHPMGPRRINMTKNGERAKKAECACPCHGERSV